jgi:outer membrane protein assembly factor BamB
MKWRYDIGNKMAGPAFSNGVVYAGSNDGTLYAIDAATGTLKWKFYDVQGFYNIPSVHYGKVFVNITAYGGNYLYALDEATGSIVWKKYAGGMSNLHPTVVNNMMYVANTSSVFAFDANTGVIKWVYDSGLAFANPTVANGVVYSNTEGSILTAINEVTGAKIWEYSDPLSSFPVGKSPTLVNNVLYTGTTSSLYAINATDGSLKWKADWAYTNFSCPVISNNILFVYSVAAELTAVNINTGQIYWKAGSVTTNPAAANGVVYVGGGSNKLYALDGKSGAYKWAFKMSDWVIADPCIVDAKGNVFYSGDSGDQN